ncbi:MAG: anaerobic ribonucleoside-triphosphate reductase activating protein [Treponema sp.]|nr:anaerobic ribonucleoside-triphosphate reductase activating protein [Treponema sp.]
MPPVTEEKTAVLRKTSLVDFPPHLSAAVFFRGCNLRCPYCYNTDLVLNHDFEGLVSAKEIISHLEKRRNVLTGLALSGGEALLNPATEAVVRAAKSLGYKIKLDTNGSCPAQLERFLKDQALSPDYLAMDIKTSPKKLWMLMGVPENEEEQKEKFNSLLDKNIRKSIALISEMPAQNREWRTVLVPPLANREDIAQMAAMLPKDAAWYLTTFAPQHCLNPAYQRIAPYSPGQEEELVKEAQKAIPGASYR